MALKLTFSVLCFQLYIKVCVVLGKFQTQIYANLHAVSIISKHNFQMVLSFFSGGDSGIQNIKRKIKKKTKCNEELIVYVKGMVNEDAQITIHEIA